jgi:RNA polymerase sigma-32 factor
MRFAEEGVLLPAEEIHALALEYARTRSPALEARLVRAHLRLVASLARELGAASRDFGDLYQEGCLGLLEAVRKFDPARGVKLSTYATWWIRARQFRFLIVNQRIVRLGTTAAQRKVFFNLRKVRERLERSGEPPSTPALARALGIAEHDVAETAARLDRRDVSLDVAREGERPMMTSLAGGDDPEEISARLERAELVRARVAAWRDRLAARDRAIFDARWLREDVESLARVGRRLGVSRERVRQLEERLFENLKPELAALAA